MEKRPNEIVFATATETIQEAYLNLTYLSEGGNNKQWDSEWI